MPPMTNLIWFSPEYSQDKYHLREIQLEHKDSTILSIDLSCLSKINLHAVKHQSRFP